MRLVRATLRIDELVVLREAFTLGDVCERERPRVVARLHGRGYLRRNARGRMVITEAGRAALLKHDSWRLR